MIGDNYKTCAINMHFPLFKLLFKCKSFPILPFCNLLLSHHVP